MGMKTVDTTVELGLCSSCGICKGVCPKECISWKSFKGQYVPLINKSECVSCGLCTELCPGLEHNYGEVQKSGSDAVKGEVLKTFNAWSKNPDIRHVSASGGITSTLISCLLEKGDYEVAFLVDSYNYFQQLKTVPVYPNDVKEIMSSSYPKSRYLPVSHENAIKHILAHRNQRIIFVGTACAVRGFLNAVKHYKLKRDNYLVIGLFCDKVFNYNVIDYFGQSAFCGDKKLQTLHFKNKESGGWPGNMKFFFSDGSINYIDKRERAKVKDYFMPERCLYCVDKLNVNADISLGDNYTRCDESPLGSNSVIIRTARGLEAWNMAVSAIEIHEISVEAIMEAQGIDWRLNNYYYGKLKQREILKTSGDTVTLNSGIMEEKRVQDFIERWKQSLTMLHAGEKFQSNPGELKKQMEKAERRMNQNKVQNIVSRALHFTKRRVMLYWWCNK